jgi:hypothetical protein
MLAELLAERVELVTGRSPGQADMEETPTRPDFGTGTGTGLDSGTTTVLVLLRSLCPADVAHGAREFAAGLAAGEAAAWLSSWTRTRFLFGNPANLVAAKQVRAVAPGGSAAWLGPFPATRLPGLSRLLRPAAGELPELPHDIDLPGTGPRRVLRVAISGLTLVDYLVHLHHTLAEAVLFGRLRPDEALRLSHRPALHDDSAGPRAAYARVLPEPGGTGLLRLHTWLSAA